MAKTKADVLEKYELDNMDKEILRLVLTHPNIDNTEIAVLVGLKRNAVSRRRNTEKFKKTLNELLAEPIDIIRSRLKKAAQNVIRTLDSTDEKLKFDASCKILYSEGILKKEHDTSITLVPNVIRIDKFDGGSEVYQTQFIEKPKTK